MGSRQSQKGGEGSQQIQTEKFVVKVGITEKRAREICKEMMAQSIKEHSQEAFQLAGARINEFENRLMPKMEAIDGALEAFADPGFQILLVEAQKTAASTERPADYDLLSELLIHRFQKGENRVTRAGISRAVEIVDEISDEALIGLTAFHVLFSLTPAEGNISKGLEKLDMFFSILTDRDLPTGMQWLDHLDILDAIRINPSGKLKTLKQYYPEILNGYIDVGIESNSKNHQLVLEILRAHVIPENILVEHELNPGYLRINVVNKVQLHSLSFEYPVPNKDGRPVQKIKFEIDKSQIKALESIFDLNKKSTSLRNTIINRFMNKWDEYPSLSKLKLWWDSIPYGVQITSVGRALAHSNAKRIDKNLPPLD